GDHLRRRRFSSSERGGQWITARKGCGHLQRGSRTIGGIFFEAAKNDALDERIKIFYEGGRIGDGLVFAKLHQLRKRLGVKCAFACEDFVENQSKGIDIAFGGDFFSSELLRRHVGRSAGANFGALNRGGKSGEAKVSDTNFSRTIEHHVGGLHIAVDYAA